MKKLAAALLCAVLTAPSLAGAETVKIKVGASPTPHAELLKVANEVLKPQGYEIQIVEYADYVQPNMALDGKELDANYFQHKPYLDDFVTEKGVNLVSIGAVILPPSRKKPLSPCPTTPPMRPARCCCSRIRA